MLLEQAIQMSTIDLSLSGGATDILFVLLKQARQIHLLKILDQRVFGVSERNELA